MSSLHIISKSPGSGVWQDCHKAVGAKDRILLIEDGIYHGTLPGRLEQLPETVKLYALRDDVQARGMSDRLLPSAGLIGYDEFVELCCETDRTVSWF